MSSTISTNNIVDFLSMASSVKHVLDHLWRPSSFVTSHDDFYHCTDRHKYEIKAGYICLVKGSNGCAHDKTYYCSFVSRTKRRELYEGEACTVMMFTLISG